MSGLSPARGGIEVNGVRQFRRFAGPSEKKKKRKEKDGGVEIPDARFGGNKYPQPDATADGSLKRLSTFV